MEVVVTNIPLHFMIIKKKTRFTNKTFHLHSMHLDCKWWK